MGIKKTIKHAIETMKTPQFVPIEHKVTPDKQFAGKTALIAGGTGGIGSAIAARLMEGGCRVIIGGRKTKNLAAVAKNLGANYAVIDYADPVGLDAQIAQAAKTHGDFDFFISSSGTHTENVDFWSMTPDEFDRVMNVNLRGTFFACRAAAKVMTRSSKSSTKTEDRGRILLIGSTRGFEPAWSPYGISKWGVRGMALGLAQQLAPSGISVNAIAPGSTATALIGYKDGDSISSAENAFGRLITPDEVASLACYLLSESARMITGETICIGGGRGNFDIR